MRQNSGRGRSIGPQSDGRWAREALGSLTRARHGGRSLRGDPLAISTLRPVDEPVDVVAKPPSVAQPIILPPDSYTGT